MIAVFRNQVEQIRGTLSKSPPGEEYQLKLAPPGRKPGMASAGVMKDYRSAAVLALLIPGENEAELVLIERTTGGGVHSGQVSFPGGRKEDNDIDFYATAVRECAEEIGVNGSLVEYVGALSPLYIPPSNFMVYPFVAACDTKPEYVLSIAEVRSVFNVPLSEFRDEKVRSGTFVTSSGFTVSAPYYEIGDFKIWGATAMMISELMAAVELK